MKCHHCKKQATKFLVDNRSRLLKMTFVRVCCVTCFKEYFDYEVQKGRYNVLSKKEHDAYLVLSS